MPEYANVCQSMPVYARVCQSMSVYARVCQSMLEYARVCQSMPEYASVCQCSHSSVRHSGLHGPSSLQWQKCRLTLLFSRQPDSNRELRKQAPR